MSQESMRFYCTEDGKRVNAVAKVGHKDKVPKYIWVDEENPPEYKALKFPDMYNKDGEQVVFPDMGKILMDIKSGRMLPSVTSMELFSDYGLQLWKQQNVAESVINTIQSYYQENGYLPQSDHDYWLYVKSKAMEDASPSDASERGQKWHGAIESSLKMESVFQLDDEEIPVFHDVMNQINEYLAGIKGKNLDVERFFVNTEHGFAGTADLRKGDHFFDVKTSDKPLYGKRGNLLKSNWIFDDRPRQLAAYAIGHDVQKPTLTNIFVRIPGPKCSIEDAGQVYFHTYTESTTQRNMLLWRTFVQAWYLKNMKDDKLWENHQW